MAVDEGWSVNTAVLCTKFWMRTKYPQTPCKVDIFRSEYTLQYFTRIDVTTPGGDVASVVFSNDEIEFNTKDYKIPKETQAQLMLLLG